MGVHVSQTESPGVAVQAGGKLAFLETLSPASPPCLPGFSLLLSNYPDCGVYLCGQKLLLLSFPINLKETHQFFPPYLSLPRTSSSFLSIGLFHLWRDHPLSSVACLCSRKQQWAHPGLHSHTTSSWATSQTAGIHTLGPVPETPENTEIH